MYTNLAGKTLANAFTNDYITPYGLQGFVCLLLHVNVLVLSRLLYPGFGITSHSFINFSQDKSLEGADHYCRWWWGHLEMLSDIPTP